MLLDLRLLDEVFGVVAAGVVASAGVFGVFPDEADEVGVLGVERACTLV